MTTNEIPSRAEMCVDIVRQALPLAVWRPFADEILSQGARVNFNAINTFRMDSCYQLALVTLQKT